MSDWIEGEPTTDGLFACIIAGRNARILRVKQGQKYYAFHEATAESAADCNGSCDLPKVTRHYRLPEPQPAIEPWAMKAVERAIERACEPLRDALGECVAELNEIIDCARSGRAVL